jgi:hypothetical protein
MLYRMGWSLSPNLWQVILIPRFLLFLFQWYRWNWMRFFYPWFLSYFLCLFHIILTQFITVDVQLKVLELHVNLVVIQLLLSQKVVLQRIFCFISCYLNLYLFCIINWNRNLRNPLLKIHSSLILLPLLLDFFIRSFQ